MREDSQRITD